MPQLIRPAIIQQKARVPVKEKHAYVFPNILAKTMKNVPMDVQYESSMMATSLILIGMILMGIYMMAFTDQTLTFKILIGVNLIGGFIFMSSSMVTTYQQYVSYKEVMDFQKAMDAQGTNGLPNMPIDDLKMKKYNRKNQVLFFGGLIIIIAALFVPTILTEKFADMSKYEYYILGVMLVIGILMMYFALRKPKQAQPKIIKPVLKAPMVVNNNQLVMRQPTSPPIRVQPQVVQTMGKDNSSLRPAIPQQVQRPIQPAQIPVNPPMPVQRPIQPQIMQPRPVQRPIQPVQQPVQRQQIPAQRPIQAARPVQQTPMRFQQPTTAQTPPKQNPLAAMRARFAQRAVNRPATMNNNVKNDPKRNKALKDVEATLNEKLYEINRLKAQQR